MHRATCILSSLFVLSATLTAAQAITAKPNIILLFADDIPPTKRDKAKAKAGN